MFPVLIIINTLPPGHFLAYRNSFYLCFSNLKVMKKIYQLLCLLVCIFLIPNGLNGQNALSIDQNEANFGKYNDNFHGWVKSVKQQFYTVASKKYADEMRKDGRGPIYKINVFYDKSGNVERVEGPGFQTTTYRYNANGDLILVDQIGDYDQKYYRRVTDYVYDNYGRLLEKMECHIPYDLSGGKAVYNFRNPDVRTKTEYRYNSWGTLSESIVYERSIRLEAVYREEYFYDKSGFLTEKIATDRDGGISMREEYFQNICTKTDYINKGKINRRIIYDKKGRPAEETGLGAGDVINTIKFKYDDEGKLVEWTSHDALGNSKEIYTGVENPAYCVKETYQYDMEGNRIGWSFYDERGIVVDRYFTECVYDKRGNWLRKAMVENKIGLDKFVIVERTIDYY